MGGKGGQVYAKTGFAPHRIPQPEGNHNGWLSEEEEADSDSESTTSNCPHTRFDMERSIKEQFSMPGHFARDCRSPAILAAPVNFVDARPNQRACYECGDPNHLRNVCPKLNQESGQSGNQLALGWCRNDRGGGNQVFPIHYGLIPLGHGSFDVIVGMDRLSHNKAVIVCHEKVVEIPLVDGEILRVHGECVKESTKALKNEKVDEPKINDISVVREFVEVFPDDLKGLPPQ
ncbi:putative reverse transcriptase domain-containing protein [Tanacetum coccineum]